MHVAFTYAKLCGSRFLEIRHSNFKLSRSQPQAELEMAVYLLYWERLIKGFKTGLRLDNIRLQLQESRLTAVMKYVRSHKKSCCHWISQTRLKHNHAGAPTRMSEFGPRAVQVVPSTVYIV